MGRNIMIVRNTLSGKSTLIKAMIDFGIIVQNKSLNILRNSEPQCITPKKCSKFLNELKIYNLRCTYNHNKKDNSKNKKTLFNYVYKYKISKK